MSINFKNEKLTKFKDFSNVIKENLVEENGIIKEIKPHASYNDNLPEGVTTEIIEKISTYNGKFITSAHVAVAELAGDVMVKNKKTDIVEAEIGFFSKNDLINLTTYRSKTYPNYLGKEGDPKEVVKHLVTSATVKVHSSKGTSLKSVKDSMCEEFRDNFKK